MLQYVTIEEGAKAGNLPSKLEVLKSLARDDYPVARLIVRADELRIADDDLAAIIAKETGDALDDVKCDISFARWCQVNGHQCSI